ncbi:MAG TPA: protoporphyrinogen oxidase [Bacteroidales bacterium]|nr:protoporphyrinogen oxidase [Bacteroidales bacterium]
MNTKPDVIIIGAGLTGLSLAHFLKKAGKKPLVLEKENNSGGVIATTAENGFVFEKGPTTGVLSTPEIARLFEDLDGRCTLETADTKAAKRYILKNNKWTALPSGPVSAVTTPLFTLNDKFRILGEPFRKPGNDPDETVAQLVRRRMGVSFLNYAVNPFVAGVYAGDPEKLVTRYALPKLYNLEQKYGSFVKGSFGKAREKKTEVEKKATRAVFSVKAGLGNMINALTDSISKGNIITGCENITVKPLSKGYSVSFRNNNGELHEVDAMNVVTTTGGYALGEILPFIPADKMEKITSLTYAKVVQAGVGYKRWSGMPLDAFGGLVPAVEKKKILGILFPSAIFECRAPEGGALLSVFLGGIRNPELYESSDSEITDIILSEISGTLYNKNTPDLIRIHRYVHAIPQYEITSGARFEAIRQIQEAHPGLILGGNIRDGIGMADRVKQAKNIADLITING